MNPVRRAISLAVVALLIVIASFALYGSSQNALWAVPIVLIDALLAGLVVDDARRRGRKGVGAFLAVFLLGPFGFAAVAVATRRQSRGAGHSPRAVLLAVAIVAVPAIAMLTTLLVAGGTFKGKFFRIPTSSMQPTLYLGDRIYAARLGADASLRRGDVVVFNPPRSSNSPESYCTVTHPIQSSCPQGSSTPSKERFVKRIIGLPGDRISIRRGVAVVNGDRLNEPYARPCLQGYDQFCNLPRSITVPAGYYFMLGDNRGLSSDSRAWGPVPRRWISHEARFIYWPLSRWRKL